MSGAAAKLDAVVTVADARWLLDRLKDAPEAKNQIAFADVILLNKTDLVTKDELDEVEARIRGINPYAKLHRTQKCAVPLDAVLGRDAFDLERILEIEPAFLDDEEGHHHEHGHDASITAITMSMTQTRVTCMLAWRLEALSRRGDAIGLRAHRRARWTLRNSCLGSTS